MEEVIVQWPCIAILDHPTIQNLRAEQAEASDSLPFLVVFSFSLIVSLLVCSIVLAAVELYVMQDQDTSHAPVSRLGNP